MKLETSTRPDARVTMSDGGRRAVRLEEGPGREAALCDAGPESACSAGGPGAHVLSEGPQPGGGVLRLPRRPAGGDAATVTARACRAHGDGSEAGGAAESWSAGSRRWLGAPGNPGAEEMEHC